METPLLQTKFHIPSLRPEWVLRPRLFEQLNAGLGSGKLTLVSAPPGFGKTTCIGAWVNTLECPVAWLSLDAADDDPGRFFIYLIAALQKVDMNLGGQLGGVLRSGQLPPGEIISATLINDILAVSDRFLLVLDDFQVIRDRFILQVIADLVSNLPQSLHLILITREDPPLPLARLRANNQLIEIRDRPVSEQDDGVVTCADGCRYSGEQDRRLDRRLATSSDCHAILGIAAIRRVAAAISIHPRTGRRI
jgi:LuxR family maltose regulon positive regulatory protein